MAPSWIRRIVSCRAWECRHMNPTPTFRFFFSDCSAALSHRRTAGHRREGLLRKDVDALADRVFEMHRPKGRVRGQQHDVAGTEAVNRLP